ncbi:hypothetical protein GCM10022409_00670 [Hymenobacter glaciei]|uniref:Uncharacterized protein n=1 Tax=Hymenobacter glaciei TaxID=877209 RepID=A0ABP7T596_9BACT
MAGRGFNLLLSGGGLVRVAGQDDDVGAHFGQFGGRNLADAGRSSGNEDNLILEISHEEIVLRIMLALT